MTCHTSTVRRSVMLLLTGGIATACYSWQSVPAPYTQLQSAEAKTEYRITTTRGAELWLSAVQFRNDSLIGIWNDNGAMMAGGVPTMEVKSIMARQQDVGRTMGLVLPLALAGIVIATRTNPPPPPPPKPIGPISCPLIYSWDGSVYRLDSGTFGGAITPALARTDMDNLIYARPFGGVLKFRMTAEAPETEHVDAITVLAIDHPVGTTVAPDARANGTFHALGKLQAPIAARDRMRVDVLPRLVAQDDISWEPRLDGRDPSNDTHIRDGVEVTFTRPASNQVQLVVDGQNTEWAAQLMGEMVAAHGRLTAAWYDPATTVAASAPIAKAQREEGFLTVELWNGAAWMPVGGIWEAGPEVAKRQVLPLDLTGVPGEVIRLRLESAPAFWSIDFVGLGVQVDVPVTTHTLTMTQASSTKYPDALSRLTTRDSRLVDMEQGDVVELTVQDAAPVARGMTRSYLLRSSGWYRVHGRDTEAPITATLAALAAPHGAARQAVVRLNEALAALAAIAQHVGQR